MNLDLLGPQARQYFYMAAQNILQELMNSCGGFRVFADSAPSQRSMFCQIQEKIDQRPYAVPNEFVSDVPAVLQLSRDSDTDDGRFSSGVDDLSVRFELLWGRLPHFLTEEEFDSSAQPAFEIQKDLYLLSKPSHL
jgi:hypothetical protein